MRRGITEGLHSNSDPVCLETGVLGVVTEWCSPGLSAQHPQALSNLLVTTTTYNQSQNVKDFNEDAIIFTVVWQTLSAVC